MAQLRVVADRLKRFVDFVSVGQKLSLAPRLACEKQVSIKSWRARGESLRVEGLRKDIGVHGLVAVHGADGNLGDVVQGLGGVGDPLAAIELIVPFLDGRLPG